MTTQQFYKQALILLTLEVVSKYCNSFNLLTDDKRTLEVEIWPEF